MLKISISDKREDNWNCDKWVSEYFKPNMHYNTIERFSRRHSEKFCNLFHICRYLIWGGDIEVRSDMLC